MLAVIARAYRLGTFVALWPNEFTKLNKTSALSATPCAAALMRARLSPDLLPHHILIVSSGNQFPSPKHHPSLHAFAKENVASLRNQFRLLPALTRPVQFPAVQRHRPTHSRSQLICPRILLHFRRIRRPRRRILVVPQ